MLLSENFSRGAYAPKQEVRNAMSLISYEKAPAKLKVSFWTKGLTATLCILFFVKKESGVLLQFAKDVNEGDTVKNLGISLIGGSIGSAIL